MPFSVSMGHYFKRTLNFLTGFLNHLLVQLQHIPLDYTILGFLIHNYTQESNLKNSPYLTSPQLHLSSDTSAFPKYHYLTCVSQ